MTSVTELGGKVVGGAELEPTSTATSLRGDLVTEGPFIESKESLGGFFLIEARDLDQILAIAKRRPPSATGIEIRPVVESPSA